MSSENRALWAEVRKLQKQVEQLAQQPTVVIDGLSDYYRAIADAALRHRQQFSYGTTVKWKGLRYRSKPAGYGGGYRPWIGRVIPRPFDARRYGKDGDEFIHIMTDDGRVRSCYPWNLEVLT